MGAGVTYPIGVNLQLPDQITLDPQAPIHPIDVDCAPFVHTQFPANAARDNETVSGLVLRRFCSRTSLTLWLSAFPFLDLTGSLLAPCRLFLLALRPEFRGQLRQIVSTERLTLMP